MQSNRQIILKKMLAELEIPESAYEKAVSRYEDIGHWFSRSESSLSSFDPHVFPQGSFRLGTAVKPINGNEEYDLDLSCKLRKGVSKQSHTQEQIKNLVGKELEAYRSARGIQEKLEAKHRCWRLNYKDELKFHADVVPAIPEDQQRRAQLSEAIRKSESEQFAIAGDTTVVITDDRSTSFRTISSDWKISNPEGYASWFKERMRGGLGLTLMQKAKVDEVPIYKRKTPLQQCVQLLKRHRDLMFEKVPDKKPISIIITTLAARAYQGETDLSEAITNIVERMPSYIRASAPRVPNPVDPSEDFADRWINDRVLETNFKSWLAQARVDFHQILNSDDAKMIAGRAKDRFGLFLNEAELVKSIGLVGSAAQSSSPRVQVIDENRAAKPWSCET